MQPFEDVFNAHDVNGIMSHMTTDCVFEASAGTSINGEKFEVQDQVRKAFEEVFATFPDAHWAMRNISFLKTGVYENGHLHVLKKMVQGLRSQDAISLLSKMEEYQLKTPIVKIVCPQNNSNSSRNADQPLTYN